MKAESIGNDAQAIDRECAQCGTAYLKGCDCKHKSWVNPKQQNNHTTIKPVNLMAYLITLGSREGDRVLDPYMGSGTTGIACRLLKRRFIGIDSSEHYVRIAKQRIANDEKYEEFIDEHFIDVKVLDFFGFELN